MPPEDEENLPTPAEGDDGDAARPRRNVRWRVALLVLLAVLGTAAVIAWLTRERIADNLISEQLEKLGVPATYTIESIGARRQVVTNLVVGDPGHPDLTIERVVLEPRLRFGVPGIGRLTLVKPRLYGTYLKGKLSFGSLDPVIFAPSEKPFSLPDFDLNVLDGRALIESDYGPVGVKAAGSGRCMTDFPA